ncbi:KUP/HAK/KT family potassium transporter [Streptomyces sp. NPDC001848]|uniref:KUP/HAK/KT family potassium transporter n=1 Tax=Streptomyces sp. NPDC001848 TaxID=3364618 RepID=UPI0036BCBD03
MADHRQGVAPDDGFPSRAPEARRASAHNTARLALVIGALGVVFGDIGTSPIYTLQTVFNPSDPTPSRPPHRTCTGWCRWCSARWWSSSWSPMCCWRCAPTTTARAASWR